MSASELSALPNASLVKRLFATTYDLFPLFGVAFLYTAIAMAIAAQLGIDQTHLSTEMVGDNLVMRADSEFQPALHGLVYRLGLGASLLAFYVFFWKRSGQTLGMQAWRLRLIRADGHPLGLGTCICRGLLGVPSLLLLGVGYFWILFHPQGLALHDQLTGTRVVQLPKPPRKAKRSVPPQGDQ